jgi:hypothetical protein
MAWAVSFLTVVPPSPPHTFVLEETYKCHFEFVFTSPLCCGKNCISFLCWTVDPFWTNNVSTKFGVISEITNEVSFVEIYSNRVMFKIISSKYKYLYRSPFWPLWTTHRYELATHSSCFYNALEVTLQKSAESKLNLGMSLSWAFRPVKSHFDPVFFQNQLNPEVGNRMPIGGGRPQVKRKL